VSYIAFGKLTHEKRKPLFYFTPRLRVVTRTGAYAHNLVFLFYHCSLAFITLLLRIQFVFRSCWQPRDGFKSTCFLIRTPSVYIIRINTIQMLYVDKLANLLSLSTHNDCVRRGSKRVRFCTLYISLYVVRTQRNRNATTIGHNNMFFSPPLLGPTSNAIFALVTSRDADNNIVRVWIHTYYTIAITWPFVIRRCHSIRYRNSKCVRFGGYRMHTHEDGTCEIFRSCIFFFNIQIINQFNSLTVTIDDP